MFSYVRHQMVGIGTEKVDVAEHRYKFSSILGLDSQSWGYSFRGMIQHKGVFKYYGSPFGTHSIIGVRLDLCKGQLEFLLNRRYVRTRRSSMVMKWCILIVLRYLQAIRNSIQEYTSRFEYSTLSNGCFHIGQIIHTIDKCLIIGREPSIPMHGCYFEIFVFVTGKLVAHTLCIYDINEHLYIPSFCFCVDCKENTRPVIAVPWILAFATERKVQIQ